MKIKSESLIPWFKGSFYFGIALTMFSIVAMVHEIINNDKWLVQSLVGSLGMGLMFIYFSGKPMVDERTRLLKLKGLAWAFVITTILFNIVNYIYTYPD